MPCDPAWFPCPGHVDIEAHDNSAACLYYGVVVGRQCGAFTNAAIARAQTDGFSGAVWKSFRKWDDLVDWWLEMCAMYHKSGCPTVIVPPPFSLIPDPVTQPDPPPCTRPAPPPAPPRGPVPTVSPSSVASPRNPTTESCHGGYAGITAASFAWAQKAAASAGASSSRTVAPAPSPFSDARDTTDPVSPSPKKEESKSPQLQYAVPRVNPSTRVQLTPTGRLHAAGLNLDAAGRAYADALNNAAAVAPGSGAAPATPVRATQPARATASVPPIPASPTVVASPTPSVLVTPARHRPPAPQAPPPPAVPTRQYGVRGVAVFYDSFADAKAAAGRLGLGTSNIMVTDNIEKLEAWMTGKPFDDEGL